MLSSVSPVSPAIMPNRSHSTCVLCDHYEQTKGLAHREQVKERFVVIEKYKAFQGREEVDLKKDIEHQFRGVSVEYGQTICFRHLCPLPEGVQRHSKFNRPKLLPSSLEWQYPSQRKRKEREFGVEVEKRRTRELSKKEWKRNFEKMRSKCEDLEREVANLKEREREREREREGEGGREGGKEGKREEGERERRKRRESEKRKRKRG